MNRKKMGFRINEKAAIGIGAMIIFIALILVAAVASTIIIKTAEELQQRAEKTGDDTRDEISGKIQIIGAYVSANTTSTEADEITLIVQLSAGSDSTLLGDIQYFIVCHDGSGAAEVNAAQFNGTATNLTAVAYGETDAVDSGETFLVPIDTSTDCTPTIGDDQELRILINGGGETYAQLHYNSVEAGSTIV